MRPVLPAALTLGGLLVLAACAGSGSPASSSTGPITRSDLVDPSMRDAYEVVQRLRPNWLRPRGRVSIQSTTAQNPVVYVDNIRFGDPRSLRQVPVDAIAEIQYLSAGDATTRFGTGHAGGVILVRTRS